MHSSPLVLCAYCGGPVVADGGVRPVAVRYCCYGCRILGESQPAASLSTPGRVGQAWWRVGLGAAIAGQTMVLGLAINLSEPTGTLRFVLHLALAFSALLAVAVLGRPLLTAGWECACRRKVGIELLFIVGIAGAFAASVYSSVTGKGAIYYEVVAILITVHTAGKMLTAHLRQGAMGAVAELRRAFATVRAAGPNGEFSERATASIEKGECVKVLPAEPIPIDGVILTGEAYVLETPLTGEPYPVVRRKGDVVLAGSYCEDGELLVQAVRSGRERQLDETLASVERAQDSVLQTSAQAEADKIAAWFLPTVVAISLLTFFSWGLRGGWGDGIFNALSVILVACPCALGLVAPLSMWRALAALASRGIIVRDARALEELSRARTVVFDKTGTLSEPRQTLVDFTVLPGFDRDEIKVQVAMVQRASAHPIARAFEEFCLPLDCEAVGEIRSLKTVPAQGLEAVLAAPDGTLKTLRLGEREWVGDGAAPDDVSRPFQLPGTTGDRAIYISIDGRPAGRAIVREKLRDAALEAMVAVNSLGCRLAILTGDREDRAASLLSGASGVPIHAGLSAMEKKRWVEEESKSGGVIFVGDGVNDAPAMAAASVGIAMGSGARLATQSASIVLVGTDIAETAKLIAYSRQLASGIRRNLIFAGVYNAIGMGLAASGRLHPVVASLLMFASSATVSWRAVRSAGLSHCELRLGRSKVSPWSYIYALAFFLQVPALIYLGRLGRLDSVAVSVLLIVAAGLSLAKRTVNTSTRSRIGAMSLAMLSVGNLGMLAGWFADAGGGRVMAQGVCLCCQSHHYFTLGWHIPWMHVGMLLAGGISMWPLLPPAIRGWNRGLYLLLSGLGMIGGMSLGADTFLVWAGPLHPHQFLIAYSGMSLGMMLGMGLGCAMGEALGAEIDRRRTIR